MFFIPYNRNLISLARKLRNNSTLSEVLLWNELKQRKMLGFQFNRQKPLGNYIVDFYCRKLNLVIEIDGNTHSYEEVYLNDIERQKILESMGLRLLRFTDREIKTNLNNVISAIEIYIRACQ